MSIPEDVSDFIRERTLVEMVRNKRDEREYNPEAPFSEMGLGEQGAIWLAGEIENQFGVPLLPLLRRDPIGMHLYKRLKPAQIVNYIVRRVH